jgi:amidase
MRPLPIMRPLIWVLATALPTAMAAPGAPATVFDPARAGLTEVRAALDAHRTTSEELVRYYLDRIARFDKRGPRINALITLNPHAIEEARRLDAGEDRRPHDNLLYGIPFIVKDNYDTAGLATSGGSAALAHSVPFSNAFVVQKLLDQGAILIGKANMSELAASYGRLGYSSAGGLTLNPYNTLRNVSGSSSGSAAAVAADFASFALGTDASGSLRGPASTAGLVALRPTLGLIGRGGIIPASLTFDTAGALTRTVADQALVLAAIAGADPRDAATTLNRPAAAYSSANAASSLKGLRLGVIENFRGASSDVDTVEKAALQTLRSRGAILLPILLPREFETLWSTVLEPVSEAEFKTPFERYLKRLPAGQPRTLAELIAISESRAVLESETPVNPNRLRALREADATELTDSPVYIHILTDLIPRLRRELEALAAKHGLTAFVFSTMSCPASPRFDREDPSYACRSEDPYKASYIASVTGFPEVTVPAGQATGNIPVGYSFLGLPYTERSLLMIAAAFEATRPRLPAPSLE